MDKMKNEILADFKILDQTVNGEPLVYLDNAATTQKPQAVIKSLVDYYEHDNANVHRGVHTLAQRATNAYEATRQKVKKLINADSEREVVYTKGTTESLNWIARGYAQKSCSRETRSFYPMQNTIPISFPGNKSVKKQEQS